VPHLIDPLICDRFSSQNFPKILDIVSQIKDIAASHGATSGQATLAWVLAQGEDFVAIPGTKKIKASSFPREVFVFHFVSS
jgi:aryl-alcohol dehydrogenase-like predicted oxidoreductase